MARYQNNKVQFVFVIGDDGDAVTTVEGSCEHGYRPFPCCNPGCNKIVTFCSSCKWYYGGAPVSVGDDDDIFIYMCTSCAGDDATEPGDDWGDAGDTTPMAVDDTSDTSSSADSDSDEEIRKIIEQGCVCEQSLHCNACHSTVCDLCAPESVIKVCKIDYACNKASTKDKPVCKCEAEDALWYCDNFECFYQ